ncbi:ASCH domain-containing protein [Fructobacillus ficulneus]|uniref:ASCH domain-containing protein n=1 Tax=Fructobacillus ficulneus TaxID=157463 RepID=A0A0K8MJL7_9LACO|nr:ASCH domain-containing protein [Fructobacillus ficulneus]GAP00060.1 hypothetical protein FFIC_280650 [Fructobacillus ficulneus]
MTNEEFFQAAKDSGVVPADAKLQSSFQFGVEADELAALVLKGKKTATASALELYQIDNYPLPEEGAFDIVLNSADEPVCVIQNDGVVIETYNNVSRFHAAAEGEGDLSLAYWRRVHEAFFTEEFEKANLTFDPDQTPIVLESFHMVYPGFDLN